MGVTSSTLTSYITGWVWAELDRAEALYPPFASAHEGYAIILEELDELWEEIKRNPRNEEAMRKEAIQVAAMALRFLKCCCLAKTVLDAAEKPA